MSKPRKFLSTSAVANMLGLSTSSIQSLVDSGTLQGWRTRGGHRRIPVESIDEYQLSTLRLGIPPRARVPMKIAVASENVELLDRLRAQERAWSFPVNLRFLDSAEAALLSLGRDPIDQLIVEITAPRTQQGKVLTALRSFGLRRHGASITLMVPRGELNHQTIDIANAIQIVSTPLSELWLHAYLTGATSTSFR